MATPPRLSATKPKIIQWLLDTRDLWPVPSQPKSKEEVSKLKTVASRALSLLTSDEQTSVLRYYHLKDAKMSLASHLLKHLVITKYACTSWAESTISRDPHGKPCFIPRSPSELRVAFNVSHQAGIVSLIAVVGLDVRSAGGDEGSDEDENEIEVGTDVVCWNERLLQDYANIDQDGFFKWVDIHADVFAATELSHIKLAPVDIDAAPHGFVPGGYGRDAISRCQWRNQSLEVAADKGCEASTIYVSSNEIIDKKLRRFYAHWCLREAYIKMTGEALLAPWLKDLEILDVRAPNASERAEDDEGLTAGETESQFKVSFKGKAVTNVSMEIVALGTNYMVGGAIRPARKVERLQLKLGKWELLDLEEDVLSFAESNT